jgi:type IV pilus assembly protein PilF
MTMSAWLRLGSMSATWLLLSGCIAGKPALGEKDNESAAAYNLQLGIDYFRQGNLSLAKEKLDRSMNQNPKNAQIYVASGMLYDRLGETKKADQYFSKAAGLEPKDGDIINSYAVFLCRNGEYKKGEELAVRAATNPLYKTPEAAYLNAGNCAVDGKRPADAEKYLRSAVAIRPNFAPALLQLAQLEFKAGNYLPARGFLERFQQTTKPTSASLWLLVQVEYALGNTSVSADYARRLKRDFPTAAETKFLLEFENKNRS